MELLRDIKAILWERANNQVFGTYVLSWLFLNYPLTLELFDLGTRGSFKTDKVIAYFSLNEWYSVFGWPAVSAVIILFALPIISIGHTKWQKKTTEWKANVLKEFESLASTEDLYQIEVKYNKQLDEIRGGYRNEVGAIEDKLTAERSIHEESKNELSRITTESANAKGMIVKLKKKTDAIDNSIKGLIELETVLRVIKANINGYISSSLPDLIQLLAKKSGTERALIVDCINLMYKNTREISKINLESLNPVFATASKTTSFTNAHAAENDFKQIGKLVKAVLSESELEVFRAEIFNKCQPSTNEYKSETYIK